MTAKEKHDQFMYKAGKATGQLIQMTEALPHKGDKCSESQKVCIMQAIHALESAILGLEPEDME